MSSRHGILFEGPLLSSIPHRGPSAWLWIHRLESMTALPPSHRALQQQNKTGPRWPSLALATRKKVDRTRWARPVPKRLANPPDNHLPHRRILASHDSFQVTLPHDLLREMAVSSAARGTRLWTTGISSQRGHEHVSGKSPRTTGFFEENAGWPDWLVPAPSYSDSGETPRAPADIRREMMCSGPWGDTVLVSEDSSTSSSSGRSRDGQGIPNEGSRSVPEPEQARKALHSVNDCPWSALSCKL